MEEKNMTPVNNKKWSNPSIGVETNSNLKTVVDENTKDINLLKEEVKELKDEISKLTGEPVKKEVKEEIKEEISMPFDSPFTEAVEETPIETKPEVNDILETVREAVKEEEIKEETKTPLIDIEELQEKKEKISVVVNRYNNDIIASTKGKGAKFVTLTDKEHGKLLSGKINEIN